MKKQRLPVLLTITAVFLAFVVGFFLGRNHSKEAVIVSVPEHMQTVPPETTAPELLPTETTVQVTFPIDINSATKEEFMALPGIGEVLAQRILAYRESNGGFSTVEGLMNVEGIGEKRMEDIWDFITIGG